MSLCSLSDKEDWDFDTSGQTYQVFEVDTSDSKGFLHTWQQIWQAEEARELQRQYSIDFEKYDPVRLVKKRKKAHKSLAIAGALCYSIMVL